MWTEPRVGAALALVLFLGFGGGAIAFAQQPAEHWLIGGWKEQETGDVIKIRGVQPDGRAIGTIGSSVDVQWHAEIKVEGSRVRIVSVTGSVIEMTRTADGDLSGALTPSPGGALTSSAGTSWPLTYVKMQRCTNDPLPAGGQSYGPPKYCVGDTWRYSDGGVQRVVKVESDMVVMTGTTTPGISCSGCLVAFDRNLVLRSITEADGKPLDLTRISRGYVPFGDGWRYWDFPLTAGKTWGLSGKAFGSGFVSDVKNYSARCKVEAYEDVTVRAGTFKAYRISRSWNRYQTQVESTSWTDMLWFAPEVKATVKYASLPYGNSWELVSYSLKDFMAPSGRH